jgi:hypothetical protein
VSVVRARSSVSSSSSPSLLPRSAEELVASARRSLTEASIASTAHERYAAAHLAALRAAAAVLAVRGRPSGSRSRVVSAWVLLPRCAPELGEWATFFAAGARKRASAEAGVACVSVREADDLVRDAGSFLSQVCHLIGVPDQVAMGSTLLHVG